MTSNQRLSEGEFWADKLMDLANLVAVVLVFGQFVTSKIYWNAVGLGIGVYLLLMMIAKYLRR